MPQRQFESLNLMGRSSNERTAMGMNSGRQGEYVSVSDEGTEMR